MAKPGLATWEQWWEALAEHPDDARVWAHDRLRGRGLDVHLDEEGIPVAMLRDLLRHIRPCTPYFAMGEAVKIWTDTELQYAHIALGDAASPITVAYERCGTSPGQWRQEFRWKGFLLIGPMQEPDPDLRD